MEICRKRFVVSRLRLSWKRPRKHTPTGDGCFSFTGQLDEAIELCKKAIELDPDFGNPYNDIGTYFMKKGELDNAVPWLEQAKEAKRYEPKHFPYLNLGRIYLSQGMFLKALKEFEVALQYDPHNAELQAVIARIRKNYN
ncbi:MAG: tetratricopeptide repeat protein [Bdellovibrionota bacterium]